MSAQMLEVSLLGVGTVLRLERNAWYFFFFSSSFFILRRMGKNKALAHHTSTYFHTRRVSIDAW